MNKNFRTYDLALQFYKETHSEGTGIKNKLQTAELRDQFHRATLSVVLNLSEGSAKPTIRDRKKFYSIALASLREVQTLLDISENEKFSLKADNLAAHLYKLCKSCG